ncbi:hypothetical protein [Lacrimispora sp.]|uniref:hypothetical protein n=1 Tax=Lacrimispora sp. TaxID=2719234 RepID=UPI003992406C
MAKLNDLTKDITTKVINQNMEYVIEKVSSVVSESSYKHMEINQDTAALIGCVTAASVSVSVELATIATISILSELGLLDIEEKPSLHIVSSEKE